MVSCLASQRERLHIEPLVTSLPATKLPLHTKPPHKLIAFPVSLPMLSLSLLKSIWYCLVVFGGIPTSQSSLLPIPPPSTLTYFFSTLTFRSLPNPPPNPLLPSPPVPLTLLPPSTFLPLSALLTFLFCFFASFLLSLSFSNLHGLQNPVSVPSLSTLV